MIKELNKLPENWKSVKLGDIFTIERGGSPRPIEDFITKDEDGINWIKIGDTKGVTKYINYTKEKIKPEGIKKSRMVYEGDFILSNSMSFGRPYIMKTSGCIHDGWLVIRQNDDIDKDYLYYSLSSSAVFSQFSRLAKGSTVKNLNIEAVKGVTITLPPKTSQLAIVSKIEELFSELDKGIEQLKNVQQQLITYRQSVLKWVFEGKYSKNLDKWESKTMKEISLKIVVGYVGPVTKHIVHSGGIKFLSTTHIGENELLEHDIREISTDFNDRNKKSQVIPGDIIIARHGDSGKACIIPEWINLAQVSNAVILRPNLNIVLPKFICYRLNAERQQMQKMKVGGVFQVVNTKSMESFKILVPPIEEQNKILTIIESRLSVTDKMEESISESLLQAEALRQSILKNAFEGRLIN
ncbi:MAG: restriction endonuclease subunit S [Bacteroidetes bacterium]|nr:restriction endonuclease subunit S [Bacteroidota bacterium]